MFKQPRVMLSAAAIGIGFVCVTVIPCRTADLPMQNGASENQGYQARSERASREVRWHHERRYVRAAPTIIHRRTIVERPTIIEHRTIVEPIIERHVVVEEPLVSAAVVGPPLLPPVLAPPVAYGPDDED
jgi:hypothetical protein